MNNSINGIFLTLIMFLVVIVVALGGTVGWLIGASSDQQDRLSQLRQQSEQQQKQIDQLYSAALLSLCTIKPGDLEECSFKDLKPNAYVVRFANLGNGSAIFEPLKCDPKEEKTHYTLVHNIPANISENWDCDQVVTIPTTKHQLATTDQ